MNIDSFIKNTISEEFKLDLPINCKSILIDGELINWIAPLQKVISPIYTKDLSGNFNPTYLGDVPKVDSTCALNALSAAKQAYNFGKGAWPTMDLASRMACVSKFLKFFKTKKNEIVKLLMWEIAKPKIEAEDEFNRTIDYIEDTLNFLKNQQNKKKNLTHTEGVFAQINRAPLGIVLCMGPYNYPLNEAFCLLIPALLMGNTCIYKPATHGVLCIATLLEAFKNSFPKGVVNIIFGRGQKVAAPLLKTGQIDVLALIGNSKAANALLGLHPKPNRLKLVLGLEAKNAAVVFADADIDLAVKECLLGSVAFNGQRCTALKILFIHQSVVVAFNKKLVSQIETLTYGLPWDKGVRLTALPESNKPKFIKELIKDAIQKGAKILNEKGGKSFQNFVFPAVLYPVKETMKIFNEEQFGPIIPIASYNKMDEVISAVENSNYGQQISLFSKNIESLKPYIGILGNQVSRVNINSKCQRGPDILPFVGRKDSAVSTLGVGDALKTFSIQTILACKERNNSKNFIDKIFE